MTVAFDNWAKQAQLPNTQDLEDFGNLEEPPFIGVDAGYFLEGVYQSLTEEFLTAGLGGFPSTLESEIEKAVDTIESFGCKLHFVFDGLQTNFDEPKFNNSISQNIAGAFKDYEMRDFKQANQKLSSSGIVVI